MGRCVLLLLWACSEKPAGRSESSTAVPASPKDAGIEALVPYVQHGPPYPIVFAHGFFGFETFAGRNFFTYFYGVKRALMKAGERDVFTPSVDPFNSSEVRGKQLQRQIEEILRKTGAAKVNIIAHSQGGLDARVVAHARPDLIASIWTIGTPHQGTPVSDLILKAPFSPLAVKSVATLLFFVGSGFWGTASRESSLKHALAQMSTEAMVEFNARYPFPPQVAVFSITGRIGPQKMPAECVTDPRPDFVKRWDDDVDTVNPVLYFTAKMLSPAANDGMTPVSSAKAGTFLGCIPADHMDEIGQIAGQLPGGKNQFRHQTFYVDLVAYLRSQGF